MSKFEIRICPQEAVSRSESLEHAGRRLLGERSALRQSLAASQQLLCGLTAAFDPLSPGQAARQEDVLQAADRLHATAAALSNRLVGVVKKVIICSCTSVHYSRNHIIVDRMQPLDQGCNWRETSRGRPRR